MDNELREVVDVLYDAAQLVKDEVEKIIQKGDMTPAELDNVYKATCIAEKLNKMSESDKEMSYGYYDDGRYNRYSSRMGRSPVTGRYVSRNGYSGHSIEDRMIAALEEQYDSAKTEHERKLLQDEIEHIRNGR